MRYLVIVQRDVTYGEMLGPGCDGSAVELGGEAVDEDEVDHQEVSKVIACETTRDVAKAVRENDSWTVWEVTPRGVQQRAIRLKMDGKMLYDVEIS